MDRKTGLPYCPIVTHKTQLLKRDTSLPYAPRSNKGQPLSNAMGGSPYDRKGVYSPTNTFASNNPHDMSKFKPVNSMYGEPSLNGSFNAAPRGMQQNFRSDPSQYDMEPDSYTEGNDQMQREIDELLQGKKNLDNINASEISTNLRQVLKGLEGFKKKVKAIGDGDDNDYEDEPQKLDLNGMTGNLIEAFNRAQKKTAKKVYGYAKAQAHDNAMLTNEIGTMVLNGICYFFKSFFYSLTLRFWRLRRGHLEETWRSN